MKRWLLFSILLSGWWGLAMAGPTTKVTIPLPIPYSDLDSIPDSTLVYTYWFDQDYSTHVTDTLTNGANYVDVTSLSEGYHLLHLRLGTGRSSTARSYLFYRPIEQDTTATGQELVYTCWFDQDYSTHQTYNLANGINLIDVTTLSEGYHILHLRLGRGSSSSARSFLFYKPIEEDTTVSGQELVYTCWFDQNYSTHQTYNLANGINLIDVTTLSEGYHILHLRLGTGASSSARSYLFYKPMQQDTTAIDASQSTLVYWFDGETTPHKISPALGSHIIVPPAIECGEQGYIHTALKVGGRYVTSVRSHRFVMMDSVCCIAPLYVTVDSITETGARIHWAYNREENFSIAIDTIPFSPDSTTPTLSLTDTVYRFSDLHSAKDYYYAVKTDCDTHSNPWVTGTWTTICRTLTQTVVATCDNYTWRGQDYTQSGAYRDTVVSVNGYDETCDSIYELQLTLHYSDSAVVDVTACRNYTWHDSTYTVSTDTARFETTTRHGCDSLVILHLTVNNNTYPDSTVYDTVCGHYAWHGRTYSSTGVYTYPHEYAGSPCPSIDTLRLTVYPKYDIHQYAAIFEGDSTWFDGNWYTLAGVYRDSLVSVNGCDSIRTLHVSIKPVGVQIEQSSVCQGVAYAGNHFQVPESVTAVSTGVLMMRDTLRSRGFDSIIFGLDLDVMLAHLNPVRNMTPIQGDTIRTGSIVLRWNAVRAATGYGVYVWKIGESMPTTPTYTTPYTFQPITTYDNYTTYNWKVESFNPCDTIDGTVQQYSIYKRPKLIAWNDTIFFGEVGFNQSTTRSIRFDGSNLVDSIYLSLYGADSAMFGITSNRLNRLGGSIDVTFTPTMAQRTYNAYLVAESGGLQDTVSLSGLLAGFYVFTIQPIDSIQSPSTPVNIVGTLTDVTGTPLENELVDVYVTIMGRTIIVTDNTDAQGHFGMTYVPLTSECGYYEVGAALHGDTERETLESFNIPGISIVTVRPVWVVTQGDTLMGNIEIRNRCNMTLHNITALGSILPAGLIISFDTITLAPFSSAYMTFYLVGDSVSPNNQYETLRIATKCDEGRLANLNAYYYCQRPSADLQIAFDSLECAIVPGQQKVVDVALYNNTDNIFHNVQLQIPSGLIGVSLLKTDSIYSIAPHDSLFIPLLIYFPDGTPLAPITGDFVVSATGIGPQLIPFVLNMVSDAVGSLRVIVSNEYTYYNNGPHVSDATVSVVGYYSLDTIAWGVTGNNGQVLFDSLPEGYYMLHVSAPENNDFSKIIQVKGGLVNLQNVDLDFQAVTYSFEVYQKDLDDHWGVRLKTDYKTNVPKPAIVLNIPKLNINNDGSFSSFDITATNYGLVDCYDVSLIIPTSETYEFVPLVDVIDTIKALSSVMIPCMVRNKFIYDTIQSIISSSHYVADTTYYIHTYTQIFEDYYDTMIYVPVTDTINDTITHGVDVWDTFLVSLPQYGTDTVVDSVIKNIILIDSRTYDTLIIIGEESYLEYGSCETLPFRLLAHYKCDNNTQKEVFSHFVIEPIDCSTTKEEATEKARRIGECRNCGGCIDCYHPNPDPRVGPDPSPVQDTGFIYRPDIKLPKLILPELPPIFTLPWECEPCWYAALRNGLECGGNILLTIATNGIYTPYYRAETIKQASSGLSHRPDVWRIGTSGLHEVASNDAIAYRVQHTAWKRAVRSKNPADVTKAVIREGYNYTRTSVRYMDEALYYKKMSDAVDAFGYTTSSLGISRNLYEKEYLEASKNLIYMGVGMKFPWIGTAIGCLENVKDAWNICFGSSSVYEIPWMRSRVTSDTILYPTNIQYVLEYYDTIHAICNRILNDTLVVYSSHPEIVTDIVSYLVSVDSAILDSVSRCYDTTITVIDTSILRRYVERWNRTISYYKNGWISPEFVPEGFSTDYFFLDTNTTQKLVELELYAMDQDYWSIDEMMVATIDSLISYPNKRSVCAGVSLQFSQEVAMTREAFEGILTIKNPHDTAALRNLSLAFTVTDTAGHDCSDKFDISILRQEGVGADSSIAPGSTGTVTVRFVPLMSAAPTDSVPYLFGGTVDYTNPYTHLDVSDDLRPVRLTVSPSPHLRLDYFMPHDIIADDPMTAPMIESAVPATVGLRVLNDGMGIARNVRLSALSLQITENRQGLAVNFSMLNTMRNGAGFSLPLGDISLGAINPQNTQTLEYSFVSSLLGTLTVRDIEVIHNSSVDDHDMNLVDAYAHKLVHPVMEYKAGSDSIHEFLTDDVANGLDRPDSLFFSTGRAVPVLMADSTIFNHYVEALDTMVQVTLYPDTIGWNYGTTADPGRGKYEIVSCVRDDNVRIPLDNVWLTFVDLPDELDPVYVNKLHLLDTLPEMRPTVYNVTFRRLPGLLMVDSITHLPLVDTYIPVDSFVVHFNKGVLDTTFTYADLSLKCNNGGEMMDSTVTVTRLDDTTFSVDISRKTYGFGLYILKVMADGIRDLSGHYGIGGMEAHWVRTTCDPYYDSISLSVCDSLLWQDTLLTASGIYYDTLPGMYGCDTILVLNLTVNYSNTAIETITTCDSLTWHGATYATSTNTPTFTSLNSAGCDSVTTLHLTVNYSNTAIETLTTCDSLTWHGQSYTTTTSTPTFTSLNAAGCDSVTTLHLTINYSNAAIETLTTCDSLTWHGQSYTASISTPTFTSLNAAGCDSVTTLHLTVNYSNTSIETVTACNSYVWHGTEYTASTNTPTYTTTNAVGCDSVVTLHLTIIECSTTAITACDSYTWHGVTYTSGGTYMDGTDTLVLTLNYSTSATETVTTCDSYTWHGTTFTTTGTVTDTLTNAAGCDSMTTLNLTVNYSNTGTETVTACNSFIWHGTEYTASTDTATYTTTNAAGCDSVTTLLLTIIECSTTTITACDSYTWHDSTYTVSGLYTDGVDTLDLTIHYSTTGTETLAACDSINWHGNTYTASTSTPTFDTLNVWECDSTVTLNLTIHYSVHDTLTETAVDSFLWDGRTLTESGSYSYEGLTVEGCDSIVVLNLIVTHDSTFIDLPDGRDIRVYPNPTSGWLTIEAENVMEVRVFDNQGKLVKVFRKTNPIDLTELPTGQYLLHIFLHDGSGVKKVIKR